MRHIYIYTQHCSSQAAFMLVHRAFNVQRNIGEAFKRWRGLRGLKGMKMDAEVALFLLASICTYSYVTCPQTLSLRCCCDVSYSSRKAVSITAWRWCGGFNDNGERHCSQGCCSSIKSTSYFEIWTALCFLLIRAVFQSMQAWLHTIVDWTWR